MNIKSIFKSKTFWFNVLGIAASYGNLLPPKYSVPTLAVANIGLRLITNQPVGIIPQK